MAQLEVSLADTIHKSLVTFLCFIIVRHSIGLFLCDDALQ